MSMREKVTSGLAWAGLVVVVAVPAVEVVKSRLTPEAEVAVASPVEPVAKPVPAAVVERTAAVPAKPVVKEAAAPVPMPAKPVVKEVAATSAPTPIAPPTEKASALQQYLATGKKLPDYITPSPAAKAPADQPVADIPAKPAAEKTPSPAPAVASVPAAAAPVTEEAVASNAAPVPVPMTAGARPKASARVVTDADLKDWKSGTLEDFLKQRGLLTPAN